MESNAPVVQLLRREAAAWESLLNLQSAVASATAKCSELSSTHDSPHSRAYLSSLTHLAACGDALVAEALKLRSLRHARENIEHQLFRHVVADHQLELFKVGEATTRSMTTNVLQVTAELRNDVARARAELTQLKAALEALDDVALRLPEGSSIVVGLRRSAEVPAAEEPPSSSSRTRTGGGACRGVGAGAAIAAGAGAGPGTVRGRPKNVHRRLRRRDEARHGRVRES